MPVRINWPAIGITIIPNLGGFAGLFVSGFKQIESNMIGGIQSANWFSTISSALTDLKYIFAGGFITRAAIPTWYENLKRPEWRPPNWMFAPVWTTLYASIGYGSYLVYRDGDGFNGAARLPLIIYGSNLVFNWLWTPIFFGAKRIDLAFYEIQLINATAVATAYLFHQINPIAGYLIVPYCLWMGLATSLNYVIWRDNKGSAKITEIKDR